ncbi:MAG: hypothetical protein H7257_13995 [Taibaiella sp.]|nr:hypothetical protein [Taibaiella sp.]
MFTIYTVYFFLIILVAVFFGIALLMGNRFRFMRNMLLITGAIHVLLMVFNENTKNGNEKEMEQLIAGRYLLDLDTSLYLGSDLKAFAGTMLIVNTDNTFRTTKKYKLYAVAEREVALPGPCGLCIP